MRVTAPRIWPVTDAEFDEEQATLLKGYRNERGILNVHRTLARHPRAARAFLTWGRYVLRESDFDPRLRELAILRTGWLCKSGYEWTQHSRVARQVGVTDVEIERVKLGPTAAGWSDLEALVLRAADELHTSYHVSDATWRELGQHLSEHHLMDLVFIVGQYTQVCMFLNSFGVKVEEYQRLDESLWTGEAG